MGGSYDGSSRGVGFGSISTGSSRYQPNTTPIEGQITTETYANRIFTLTGDGVNSSFDASSATFGAATDNLRLFFGYNSNSKGAIYHWKHKKVVNDVLTLVEYLIPAKNSSSEIGMYDFVTGQFFTNAGTGTFTAGPERSAVVEKNYHSEIPSEYTELEYIESDGFASTIDTGIAVNSLTSPHIKTKFQAITTADKDFFGTTNNSPSTILWNFNYGNNVSFIRWASTSGIPVTYESDKSVLDFNCVNEAKTLEVITTDILAGNYYIDGVKIGTTGVTGTGFASTDTIRIGRGRTYADAKWYFFEIYDGDTIKFNGIPVQRISDGAYGMYDLVSKTFFGNSNHVGSFTAGPANMLEVPLFKYNGVGDKTENLWNFIQDSAHGGYVNNDGTFTPSYGYYHTDLIEVEPNTAYTVKGTWDGVAQYFYIQKLEYDASGNMISGTYFDRNMKIESGTFTTTATTKYVRVSGNINRGNEYMFVKGSTAPTSYVPYGYAVTETIGTQGVVDMGTLLWSPIGNGTFYATVTDKANGRNIYSTKYPTDQNGIASGTEDMHIGGHNGNRVYFKNTTLEQTRAAAQADLSGVYLYYQRTTDDTFIPPTTYTSYLSAPLYKVGDYADSLNATTGVVTRNVGMKVLDGTENWSWNADNGGRMRLSGLGGVDNNTLNIMCSHYKASGTSSSEVTMGINLTVAGDAIWLKDTANITDLASGKAYLAAQYAAGTPVTIYYPLATPTTENVTPIGNIPLFSTSNYTIIPNTSVLPSSTTLSW